MNGIGASALVAAWLFGTATQSLGETFLGEEGQAPDKAPEQKRQAPAKAKKPPLTSPSQRDAVPSLPDDVEPEPRSNTAPVGGGPVKQEVPATPEGANRVTLSGGIGTGSEFVSGQGRIGFYFLRYVGVEASYYYDKNMGSNSGSQYGPELDLVVRFSNPTMMTPLLGFGPGYTTWHRSYNGSTFSDGSTFTGNLFYGLDVNLTKHFGIEILRKQETYWDKVPLRFADRSTPEARSAWATQIGFRVSI